MKEQWERLKGHEMLYHDKGVIRVANVVRYVITYNPVWNADSEDGKRCEASDNSKVFLRVHNCAQIIRRAQYLNGPYFFCVSVRDAEFNANDEISGLVKETRAPIYDQEVKASSSFWAELPVDHKQFTVRMLVLICRRTWIIEITSQAIFGVGPTTYRFTLANSKETARTAARADKLLHAAPNLCVRKSTTDELWTPARILPTHKNVHLVVLTHGLFSNVTADMLYLKDRLEQVAGVEHRPDGGVIVLGYNGNVRKTEIGIELLGKRMATWLLAEMLWLPDIHSFAPDAPRYSRISFIGHSQGGVVQLVAIGEIDRVTNGKFFERYRPVNLITLASPWLGISSENPAYVSLALDSGVLGLTGQDLALMPRPNRPPILARIALPDSHCHCVVRTFFNRTIYANAINDGIVPLRSAAMFFLDWTSLDPIKKVTRSKSFKLFQRRKTISSSPESEEMKPMASGAPTNSDRSTSSSPRTPALLRFFSLSGGHQPGTKKPHPNQRSQTLSPTSTTELGPPPPTTSVLEMFPQLLNPPLPSANFITHPDLRPPTFIHDEVYTPLQIPPEPPKMKLPERIARDWHYDMSWRKVLVRLQPEAHNNIIVRRMFPNAYGWPVIEHVVREHFLRDPVGLPGEWLQEHGVVEPGEGMAQSEEGDVDDENGTCPTDKMKESDGSGESTPSEGALISDEDEMDESSL
jgi:Putative serine esterase (DUF676)